MKKYQLSIVFTLLMSVGVVGCTSTPSDPPDAVLFTTPTYSLEEENRILKALTRSLIQRLQQEMQENGQEDTESVNILVHISESEWIVVPIFFDKEEDWFSTAGI